MRYLALAAAGAAAVVGLTACSSAAAPSAAPASSKPAIHSTPGGTQPAPAGTKSSSAGAQFAPLGDCTQQYERWKNDVGKQLVAELNVISSAGATGNAQAASAALKKAMPTITKAGRDPVPACVDPKGSWGVLLMHLNAAANATSPSSMQAAMKGVAKIQRDLKAELQDAPR